MGSLDAVAEFLEHGRESHGSFSGVENTRSSQDVRHGPQAGEEAINVPEAILVSLVGGDQLRELRVHGLPGCKRRRLSTDSGLQGRERWTLA